MWSFLSIFKIELKTGHWGGGAAVKTFLEKLVKNLTVSALFCLCLQVVRSHAAGCDANVKNKLTEKSIDYKEAFQMKS